MKEFTRNSPIRVGVATAIAFAVCSIVVRGEDPAPFINAPRALAAEFGEGWREVSIEVRAESLRRLAESLPVGGAIQLPEDAACGELDFRAVADDVQITGGYDGEMVFGGGQRGMQLVLANLDQRFITGVARPMHKRRPLLLTRRVPGLRDL